MKRRSFLAGASTLLAAPAIAQDMRATTLRFVPQANLTVLDPIWTTATVTNGHGNYVFDTLYGSDAKMKPQPQMAGGHEVSADGRVWRIRLRDDLWFHDGTPVRAQDAAASIARWAKRDSFGQLLDRVVERYGAVDDRTIEIRLTRPFPLMLDALGKAEVPPFIMPERLAKTDPNTAVREMVGSGPFRFIAAEYNSGSRVVYEKFDRYVPRSEPAEWLSGGKIAHFKRVEWIVIPDNSTAAAALGNGEVDWWERPLVDLVPQLKRNPNVTVQVADPAGRLAMLRTNHAQKPFDNLKLRKVMMAAVQQEDYMRAARGDDTSLWTVCRSLFPKGSPYFEDMGTGMMPGDLTVAKKLLDASGYGGEKIALINPTDFPDIGPLGQITNEWLKKLGMNVDFQETDWGTVVQRRASREPTNKGGWSIFHTTGSASTYATPAANYLVRGQGASAWFGWWNSPAVETLADEWLVAADPAEQLRLGRAIGRLAMEDVSCVPVGQFYLQTAFRKNLAGVLQGPSPYPWNVRRV
jgi:peptide/nickel transport system substrate-binding protein